MTRKNYCNNCKEYKESWADKLGSHHSDSRCWECNNYSLDKSKVQVVEVKVRLEKESTSCSLYDDGTCGIKTAYYNDDGSSTTTYLREGKKKEIRLKQVSSSERHVIICTRPEQTASNVEYTRPPSPCRIS